MSTETRGYQEDSAYFLILFDDPDLREPIIRTLQFVKHTRRDDGTPILLFRDLGSKDKAEKLVFDESSVGEVVLTGAELIARLQRSFRALWDRRHEPKGALP